MSCCGNYFWNGTVWGWVDGCCDRAIGPPSSTPPWARPVMSPNSETLTVSGPISLTVDPTFLERQVASPSVPQSMTLPNGNYIGQTKTIIIPGNWLTGPNGPSETFNIAGIFAGYSSLTLDVNGFIAILFWDGSSWSLAGGNAVNNP